MRKNSITRFDSKNIAYVDFDTDTKEGTAGVFDEVNGQDYPFSGGGGVPYLIDPQEITIAIPDSAFPEIQVNDEGAGNLSGVEFILLRLAANDEDDYYVLAQQSVNLFTYEESGETIVLSCDSDTHIWHIFYGEDTGGDEPEPVEGTFEFSAVGTW